jgi:hypothetical protein
MRSGINVEPRYCRMAHCVASRGSHSRDASRITCAEMLTAMSTNVAIHRSFACSREVALRVRTRLTSVNLQLAQLLNYRTPIRPHILNELLKPILDQKPLVSFRQPDRRERGPFGRLTTVIARQTKPNNSKARPTVIAPNLPLLRVSLPALLDFWPSPNALSGRSGMASQAVSTRSLRSRARTRA